MSPPLPRRVSHWVRRSPRVQAVVHESVKRVRRNALVTDVAWRVFLPERSLGVRPVALNAGRALTGPDVVFLPVVGFLALGLPQERVVELIGTIAERQRELASFKPLLILDRPVLAAARDHGFVVELVTPAEGWAEQAGGSPDHQDWVDHVGGRLAAVADLYQLVHLVRLGEDGIDPLDAAFLRHLGARLPEDLDVRRTGSP